MDAREIGSRHTVTALYELKPGAGEGLATVRVRAKRPRGESATECAYRFPARTLLPLHPIYTYFFPARFALARAISSVVIFRFFSGCLKA